MAFGNALVKDQVMSRDKSENPIVRLLAAPFLVALGLLFGAAAIWPGLRKSIEGSIGEGNFIYLGVGFLFMEWRVSFSRDYGYKWR